MKQYLEGVVDVLEISPYDFADANGRNIKGISGLVRIANRDCKVGVNPKANIKIGDGQSVSFSVRSSKYPGLCKLVIEGVDGEVSEEDEDVE